MKKCNRVAPWVLLPALLIAPMGCQTMSEHKTASGAVIGGLVGAAAGAAIDDKSGRGAAIGAATGAALGAGVGYYLQKRSEKYKAIEDVDVQVYEPPANAGPPAASPTAPSAETTLPNIKLTVDSAVLFAQNSSTLSPAGASKIAELAGALREDAGSDIVVKGFTSSEGEEDYNLKLSELRAESVRRQILANGIPAERITAVGLGESNPVASNATEEGRMQNRRVEIVVFPRQ